MLTLATPRTKEVMRANDHSLRSARRGGKTRPPGHGSVGKRTAAKAKHRAAVALIAAGLRVSCHAISATATPQHPEKNADPTARIARASVGKSASRSRLQPGAAITCHQVKSPTARWMGLTVKNMTIGVSPTSNAIQPAWPMAKETRSRRRDEECWAARSLAVMGWGLLNGEPDEAVVVVTGAVSGLLDRLMFRATSSVAVPGAGGSAWRPDLWTVLARDQARAGSGSGSRTIGPRAGEGRGGGGSKKGTWTTGGSTALQSEPRSPADEAHEG